MLPVTVPTGQGAVGQAGPVEFARSRIVPTFVDWFAMKARCVSGFTPMANGTVPDGIMDGSKLLSESVPTFAGVARLRSIIETELSPLFTTYARWSGTIISSTATPVGCAPTAMALVINVSVRMLISDTEFSPVFATTAMPSAWSIPTADGAE